MKREAYAWNIVLDRGLLFLFLSKCIFVNTMRIVQELLYFLIDCDQRVSYSILLVYRPPWAKNTSAIYIKSCEKTHILKTLRHQNVDQNTAEHKLWVQTYVCKS